MTVRSSITAIKLASIAFLSISIVFIGKYYDSQSKNKKLEETIKIDKKTYSNDLKEIFDRFDLEVLKNKQLLASKTSNSHKSISEDEIRLTNQYYSQNKNLKIDSLKKILKKEKETTKSLKNEVEELTNKNKALIQQNANNEKALSGSKNLTATNVYANGVKKVSNTIIETKEFSTTEQIKVCFTLLENKFALKGNKDIYIQIVNPNNKIVSKIGDTSESKDKLLNFSTTTNVFYDNMQLDVCVFVEPNKEEMCKGDYEINIFSGINLIGNTIFSLK